MLPLPLLPTLVDLLPISCRDALRESDCRPRMVSESMVMMWSWTPRDSSVSLTLTVLGSVLFREKGH